MDYYMFYLIPGKFSRRLEFLFLQIIQFIPCDTTPQMAELSFRVEADRLSNYTLFG